ncbi:hypothetical protein IE81DRAFT_349050 [Ceraceosorus guamensis]|uniref:Uncharacterized protein n=1 Tax=Ceraceosorus guamensis TaxID=1522189 RepID=A0A316VT15_9BASI|nr:hypothetical protein IE81DRAFT_349050 [Ceraceosorus guamensis]PWN40632.1 hypothetical protein IE81DRAFT_349050 [Ceraceosorus guamensis]
MRLAGLLALAALLSLTLLSSSSKAMPTDYMSNSLALYDTSAHLDKRLAPAIVQGIARFARLLEKVIGNLVEKAKQDKAMRIRFTQDTVNDMSKEYPDTNILIVHPKHDFHPGGTKGVDWFHEHKEVDIQVGGTIGYEVYGFQDGWIKRYGDGGYINWAWNGVLAKDPEEDKSKITFSRRKN